MITISKPEPHERRILDLLIAHLPHVTPGDARTSMKSHLIEITWSAHAVELLDLATLKETSGWITTLERWSGPALPNGTVQYRVQAVQLSKGERTWYELRYLSEEQPYEKAFQHGRSGRSLISLDESGHVQAEWAEDGVLATVNRSGSEEKFRPALLAKVSPEHIWLAVQGLQDGSLDPHPFGAPADVDLVADNGQRLSPNAVFGIALGMTLEIPVAPENFSGGEGARSFEILRAAGFPIIPKDGPAPDNELEVEEGEWEEGRQFLRSHVVRERARGLAKAKKAQFVRLHGVLRCEQCGLVPAVHYATALADSCIEVHHAERLVSEMGTMHKTRLEDLQCLCANCHRLVHRQMRERTGK